MTKHVDVEFLRDWIGKEEIQSDTVSSRRVAQMAGTLGWDRTPAHNEPLPMPWYWLFFNPVPHVKNTGGDGHPAMGDFHPPVPYGYRMWGSSRVASKRPILVGQEITRTSRVEDIQYKLGSRGPLIITEVSHEIVDDKGESLVSESQQIVYRESAWAQTDRQAPSTPYHQSKSDWQETVHADPVLLFRYSALTFNGHRIHYDQHYAMNDEGYPGLVVQGPLTVSLLLSLLYRQIPGAHVIGFSFRAMAPLFHFEPMRLYGSADGDDINMTVLNEAGQRALAMKVQIG